MKKRRKPRIVCLGGGTGQSVILQGLSRYPVEITAIVGVTDNGGHSGLLRRIFGIPQVGDIRNCLASLAHNNPTVSQLLKYRFSEGSLDGVSMGNLMVVALIRMRGSLSKAIDELSRLLGVHHRILPVSDEDTQICAELANGRRIKGEWEIMMRKPRTPIARLYHNPPIRCLPLCAEAIKKADMIIFCPGSLQTGILSTVLTGGIREALSRTRAKLVQMCNIMTQVGQTDRFTASDHLDLLARYTRRSPHYFIVNTDRPARFLLPLYKKAGSVPVRLDDIPGDRVTVLKRPLIERSGKDVLTLYARHGKNMKSLPHFIRHDPHRLGRLLMDILNDRV